METPVTITLSPAESAELIVELFYATHQHENNGQYNAMATADRLRLKIKAQLGMIERFGGLNKR